MGTGSTDGWRLVLWDVDRTLLHVEGVSRLVYEDAFLAVIGRPLEQLADMPGRTDRYIVANTLALHGVQDVDGLLDSFYRELGNAVRTRREQLRANGRALAGARQALDAVAREPQVVQSVVTGNTREIATEKLAAFGLEGLLDLKVGAYGNDATDRRELVRLARERAEKACGVDLPWERVVVVGDTEHDIAGAAGERRGGGGREDWRDRRGAAGERRGRGCPGGSDRHPRGAAGSPQPSGASEPPWRTLARVTDRGN